MLSLIRSPLNYLLAPFNPALPIDGYKLDHRRQYPDKTEYVESNFTPRSSRIPGVNKVVFMGLQFALFRYLVQDAARFFHAPEELVCDEYMRRVNGYLGPNQIGVEHIRQLHRLGHLPLEFHALPEGTEVPLRVPMFIVRNTHPDFAWLVNYYETLLSSLLWMPCTSATTALRLRRLLTKYAHETGAPQEFVPWQGHDFSMRGMPGPEAAILSGIGHLSSFTGTDTMPAIDAIEQYYLVPKDYFIAGSVAATEHSVMCAGGDDRELETFERLLNLYPEGILSVVSDTWDLWNVLTNILPQLKHKILARNGKLVIRPDSGDPVKIVCGDPDAPEGSPARKGVIELLHDLFGGTVTDKGFRVLDSHIGCIYGDSINYERMEAILEGLKAKGFASNNMVFGVGSYTYQHVTRDTFGFAIKATSVVIDGVEKAIYKKPATDDGQKNSAVGRLAVLRHSDGELVLVNNATEAERAASELKPVWRNGHFTKETRFDEVRARLLSGG